MEKSFDQINKERKLNQQILVYKHLIQGAETVKQVIPSFDGKIINVRLLREINSFPETAFLSFVNRDNQIQISDDKNRCFQFTYGSSGFVDVIRLHIDLVIESGRLNAQKTLMNIEEKIADYKSDLDKLSTGLAQFEEEAKDWDEIKALVEAYKNKYPLSMQGNIEMRK